MDLQGYEVLEVVGKACLRASDDLKDGKMSTKEAIINIATTLKELAEEAIDGEPKK